MDLQRWSLELLWSLVLLVVMVPGCIDVGEPKPFEQGHCETEAECPDGQTCQDGRCVPRCSGDGECGGEAYCLQPEGVCWKDEPIGAPCDRPEMCVTYNCVHAANAEHRVCAPEEAVCLNAQGGIMRAGERTCDADRSLTCQPDGTLMEHICDCGCNAATGDCIGPCNP